MSKIIILILIFIGAFFVYKFISKFKVPKIGSLALVTGGVKCGKSTLSVAIALSEHRKRVRKTKFKNFFRKLFKKDLIELPLLYSNVPLACKYSPVTTDLLLRKQRFVYGSVIYLQEASLVADSQLIKDKDINEQLLLFNKLIGHSTKGGVIIYDTQSVSDNHYSIKRCLSEYFYIHHLTKWIPFILIAHVEENRYSDDGTVISTQNEDIEKKLKRVIISKKTWKMFDCYCYSVLTDNLPVKTDIVENNLQTRDLKAYKIISFRSNFNKVGVLNEKKDDK
ncbi:MAG: hypothetical protein IJA23_00375 [Clostridia bacterium]|nr:hypothetical protein [Clostridia bacterium]